MPDRRPAILFFPSDWNNDNVSGCSWAAQGLWLRMLNVMHFSDPYGHLATNGKAMSDEEAARRCGGTVAQYLSCLAELDAHGVPSRNADGIIYSRRMVRDERKRLSDKKNGKRGGNPALQGVNPPLNPPVNPPVNPTLKMKDEDEDEDPGKRGAGGKTLDARISEFIAACPTLSGAEVGRQQRELLGRGLREQTAEWLLKAVARSSGMERPWNYLRGMLDNSMPQAMARRSSGGRRAVREDN